jgi:hypothetical protein
MSTGAGVSWHDRFDYVWYKCKQNCETPAGVVYRRFRAEHAHASAAFMLGIVSVVRALHSLVLHKCTVSVLDIFIALVH